MKKLLSLLLTLLLFTGVVNAQEFLGYNYSNYQTVGGMIFNPASIADSRYSVNVNIFSFNAGLINNGYEIRRKSIFDGNFDNLTENVDFFKINNSAKKNVFFNLDILGPSFMVDMGPKAGAFGISSRVRIIGNEKNLNNDIFQLFGDANASYFGTPYTQNNLMVDAHIFADFGLSYARVLWQNNRHTIKGGVTGKYVMGLLSASGRVDNLNVEIDNNLSTEMVKSLKGNMNILYSAGADKLFADRDDLEVKDIWDYAEKSGNFGMDFGVEYEWYRDGDRSVPAPDRASWLENCRTRYFLKASVSVTDIGRVKYTSPLDAHGNTYAGSYSINDLPVDYPVTRLEPADGMSMDEYLDYLEQEGIISIKNLANTYKVSLPTTLRMNVDWNAYKRLFVNAGAHISVLSKNSYGARYGNYYYMTPRYEAKWFSVYSPVAYNSLKQVNWGIGFNVGPFFIGSGSILSNLMSKNIKGADVHMGLSIPIFKKKPKSKASKPAPVIAPMPVIDSDGDGIPDDEDECPNVPGLARYKGCPIPDSDGDGINDEEDECPDVPGLAKYKGCPAPDRDGDGVPDDEDECPDVPGLVKYKGCPPPDRDGDGVPDDEDLCPDEPGPASNNGCPEIKQEVVQKVNLAAQQIFFASGSDQLLLKSHFALNDLAKLLKEHPSVKINIEGHTDNTGNANSNLLLSEKRAQSVQFYLESKGISGERMTATGYGQTKPIADNSTTAGRSKNRRVEINMHY